MLPLIALAAPLIGGAMSLAGGAMSMTGGVMAAGSTMAGIAADAASGVIGAASRLTGGGKSAPEPEAEVRAPADQSTSDEQGAKALPPGVKLNKNGVMIQDSGGPGGGRILPGQFGEDGQLKSMDERLDSVTADRSGASPVNQILDYVKVIAANTARTAMGIGALMQQSAASTAQDNIDDSKNKTQPKQGMISKVFGGLTDRMRKISGSLGGVAKFMLKGLGLAGLIYLFKRNEESITKAVAGIFKFFHDLAKTIKESDDPIGDLMKFMKDKLTEWGNGLITMATDFYNNSVMPKIVKATTDFIGWMWNRLKTIINDTLGMKLFRTTGDVEVRRGVGRLETQMTSLEATASQITGTDDLGLINKNMKSFSAEGNLDKDTGISETQRTSIGNDAAAMLNEMFAMSAASDWAIQWTKLGINFGGPGANTLKEAMDGKKIRINDIMASKPIVIDEVVEREDLKKIVLNRAKGYSEVTNEDDKKIIDENNAKIASLTREKLAGETRAEDVKGGFTFMGKTYASKIGYIAGVDTQIANLQKENLILGAEPMSIGEYDSGSGASMISPIISSKSLEKDETDNKNISNGSTNMIDASTHDNSMVKQGDTLMMPLDVHHSDPTQKLLTDMAGT